MIKLNLTLSSVLIEGPRCQSHTQFLWLKLNQTLTPTETLILNTTLKGLSPLAKFLVTKFEFGGSLVWVWRKIVMRLRSLLVWGWREFVISFIHNFTTSSYLILRWPKIPKKSSLLFFILYYGAMLCERVTVTDGDHRLWLQFMNISFDNS
jgi:hypothetical protein